MMRQLKRRIIPLSAHFLILTLVLCGQTTAHALVTFLIGDAAGGPGDTVTVTVSIESSDGPAALGNDLMVPSEAALVACQANPPIGKDDTGFSFTTLDGAQCALGIDCRRVHAGVFSFENLAPVPDGATLYSCSVRIDAQVSAGSRLEVRCALPGASTAPPDARPLETACRDGAIQVLATTHTPTITVPPTPTGTPTPTCTPAPVGAGNLAAVPLRPIRGFVAPSIVIDHTLLAASTSGEPPTDRLWHGASVFEPGAGGWVETARFPLPDDEVRSSTYGQALALSGDTLVVGARGDREPGAVFVYRRHGEEWAFEQKVVGSDAADGFGGAVGLSGDVIIVGDPISDAFQPRQTEIVFIFRRTAGQWQEESKMVGPRNRPGFGTSVGISGDTAVIGGGLAARVWRFNGAAWTEEVANLQAFISAPRFYESFGGVVRISGPTVIVASSVGRARVVDIFERHGGAWRAAGSFEADAAQDPDEFGRFVAIDGGTAVVGQTHAPAEIVRRRGARWTKQESLVWNLPDDPLSLGHGVAVSRGVMALGRNAPPLEASEIVLHEPCSPGLIVHLGDQTGQAGNPAELEVTLENRATVVSHLQFEIPVDPTVWAPLGGPDATVSCTVADDLADEFVLTQTFLSGENRLRIALAPTGPPEANLPRDGWVGSCPIAIVDGAVAGVHLLRCATTPEPEAADSEGAAVVVVCSDGELDVSVCAGDCNRDGGVSVNELITGVGLLLSGGGAASCPAMDSNGDDRIMVSDLVAAVTSVLAGC
jgi:FG-GAP repeat